MYRINLIVGAYQYYFLVDMLPQCFCFFKTIVSRLTVNYSTGNSNVILILVFYPKFHVIMIQFYLINCNIMHLYDNDTQYPKTGIKQNKFFIFLDSMHPNIIYTMGAAKEYCDKQLMNFTDIDIILKNNCQIETDIYYKITYEQDCLYYNSFYHIHCKNDTPYNLAMRIIVFSTCL